MSAHPWFGGSGVGASSRASVAPPELRERWRALQRLVEALLLVLASMAVRWVFARWSDLFFPAYRSWSKALMGALASVCGVVPFALWDLGLAVGVVGAVVASVRRVREGESLLPVASVVALVVSLGYAVFVGGWALNHYAPSLADELGFEVRQYTVDELAAATEHYLLHAAELAPQVPRDADSALERQDFFELARIAGASYEGPSQRWELFRGTKAPVKALLLWGEPLLWSGHTGIFWAPTGEAGVPLNSAIADEPYIMCHEAAHRLGLASEQEANFAAYLACAQSSDVRFAYAGAYNAFCYCFNALYRMDADWALQLLQDDADAAGEGVALLWGDRLATHEHYAAYDGPFEKVGTTVNDHYLKSFGETSGVRSYGLVVDYLIAWQLADEA